MLGWFLLHWVPLFMIFIEMGQLRTGSWRAYASLFSVQKSWCGALEHVARARVLGARDLGRRGGDRGLGGLGLLLGRSGRWALGLGRVVVAAAVDVTEQVVETVAAAEIELHRDVAAEDLAEEVADAGLGSPEDLHVDRQSGRPDLLERPDRVHRLDLAAHHQITGDLDAEREGVDRVEEALERVQAAELEVAVVPVLAHHEVLRAALVVAREAELVHLPGDVGDAAHEARVLRLLLDLGRGLERDLAGCGQGAQAQAGVVLGQDGDLLLHASHDDEAGGQAQHAGEAVVVAEEGAVTHDLLHQIVSRVSIRSCERPLVCCSNLLLCRGRSTF